MLSLDLPPIPLFKNSNNDYVVNQVFFWIDHRFLASSLFTVNQV